MLIKDNNWITGGILPEGIAAAGFLIMLITLIFALFAWAATDIYGKDEETKKTFVGLGIVFSVGVLAVSLSIPHVHAREADFNSQIASHGFTDVKLERGERTMKAMKDGKVVTCYFLNEERNDWKIICE